MKTATLLTLTLLLMIGCTNQEDDSESNNRLIKLNAGVTTVVSKAPVTEGSFEATIAGWEANNSTPDYTAQSTWTSSPTTITIGSSAPLTLTGNPQYNLDNSIKTFIAGWYPAGTPTNGMISITSPNGETDVMYASPVSGSISNKIKESLKFNHLLTQFKFVVVKGNGWDDAKKLQSITIDQAQLPQSLNLSRGTLTFSAQTPLLVPDISNQTITVSAKAGVPVMIASIAGNQLPLTIITNDGSQNETAKVIATTTDPNYEAGKAYTVTITFNSTGIGVTALVSPWLEGSASGSVQ